MSTVQNSQDMDGAVGTIARCCGRKMPCLCGRRTRRDSSTASGVAAAASAPRSSSARRLSLNAGLGRRALLRKVKSRKARQLVSSAEQHRISLHERVSSNQGDAKRRLMKRLKLRKQPVSSAAAVLPAASSPGPSPAPQKWETHVDGSTGKTYYFNVETGKTTWDLPMELTPVARPTVSESSPIRRSTYREI